MYGVKSSTRQRSVDCGAWKCNLNENEIESRKSAEASMQAEIKDNLWCLDSRALSHTKPCTEL